MKIKIIYATLQSSKGAQEQILDSEQFKVAPDSPVFIDLLGRIIFNILRDSCIIGIYRVE